MGRTQSHHEVKSSLKDLEAARGQERTLDWEGHEGDQRAQPPVPDHKHRYTSQRACHHQRDKRCCLNFQHACRVVAAAGEAINFYAWIS